MRTNQERPDRTNEREGCNPGPNGRIPCCVPLGHHRFIFECSLTIKEQLITQIVWTLEHPLS